MCGRYAEALDPAELVEEFQIIQGPTPPSVEVRPSWNIAPSQAAPIVGLAEGRRALRVHRWGLLTGWMDPKGKRPFLARGETVATNRMFDRTFARRRCLVPASGFYEWQETTKKGRKVPHYFSLRDAPVVAFAGIWEACKLEGQDHRSFAIITCAPNELVAQVHDRMPVILPRDRWDAWLDPATPTAELLPLLCPYPADAMVVRAVSPTQNGVEVSMPGLPL